MIKIGIIGCGQWGANLVRNFLTTDNCEVKYVSEPSKERQKFIKTYYDGFEVMSDNKKIFSDKEIDAVVIATPPSSHYDLAKKSLEAGKHTFVEKPLALKLQDAAELVEFADRIKKVLMVGHTVIYNDSIEMVKNFVNSGEIGDVYYVYASRLNLGKVRSDVNVMWNLAPHDISVILYLLEKKVLSVSAKGLSYIQPNIEDVVYLNLNLEDKINAQIHLSWLDPNKKRDITIVGSKKMLVYDDTSEERIKIYDKGIDKQNKSAYMGEYKNYGEYQLIQRAGDVVIPRVKLNEPLKKECQHFVDCILSGSEPLTSGRSALEVVEILEHADKSLQDSGKEIYLNCKR